MAEALALIPLATALVQQGLLHSERGSLSYRVGERFVITARGAALDRLLRTNLILLDGDGALQEGGGLLPAADWPLHAAAFRARPAARVVVCARPFHALAFGLLGRSLPAATPEQYAALGRDVPLVAYRTPRTRDALAAVSAALQAAPAALLQGQGVLLTAETPDQAHHRLALLDEACALLLAARAAGTPRVLSDADMHALDQQADG